MSLLFAGGLTHDPRGEDRHDPTILARKRTYRAGIPNIARWQSLGFRGCLETAMGGLNPDNSMESERSPIPGAFDVDPRDPGRA